MFYVVFNLYVGKCEFYVEIVELVQGLLVGECDLIVNVVNFSVLLFYSLLDFNWVGFYFYDGIELVVGLFQGKLVCICIVLGCGVCGMVVQMCQIQLVMDVYVFEGYIVCDVVFNLEIVVLLVKVDGLLFGVWDVDSLFVGCFDDEDCVGMEVLCVVFMWVIEVV